MPSSRGLNRRVSRVSQSLRDAWLLLVVISVGFSARAEDGRAHWAFQPLRNVPLMTAVDDGDATPIDALLQSARKTQGLTLSDASPKESFLRRATFDLLGMPPTVEEIADYQADASPDAALRLLDRLLASPHYGETWGRTWLDLVRYADTAGFNADPVRPRAFQYRDYVIRAFNDDLPYDRFIREQLAGDEAFPDRPEALIATGYNRLWPDESNASDVHLARQLALDDLTGNVSAVYLGLSLACAQCHDHKFDPLTQRDFYRMQAFFAGIVLQEESPVAAEHELADYERRLAEWKRQSAPVRRELREIESLAKTQAGWDRRRKFPADVLAAIDTANIDRTALQHQLAFWSERQAEIKTNEIIRHLDDPSRERRVELLRQLAEMERRRPEPPGVVAGMMTREISPNPPETHLLAGGSHEHPIETVLPGFPNVLDPDAPNIAPTRAGSSGRRTALAAWLGAPDNALAQRVIVNRLWQGHFGRGFVANANDFGTQTPVPRQADLFEWLTREFSRRDQSFKAMHRLIMSSATYRQRGRQTVDSSIAAVAVERDPLNQLYWHFPRQRLTAERIRDAWLAVSGELNDALYGPGVFPELPAELDGRGGWKTSENLADRRRRSVYIFAKRNLPYPLLQSFDFPDMHESCGCRTQVTIAPQALLLLNNDLVLEAARHFAERLRPPLSTGLPDEVDQAFLLAFGRRPTNREYDLSVNYLRGEADEVLDALHPSRGSDADSTATDAFVDFCHALLNANEFLYVE